MKTIFRCSGIKRWIAIGSILTVSCGLVLSSEITAGEYGYLIDDVPLCSIWWAEGAYKIMKDDPVPTQKSDHIYLQCAVNEYEPFQLVLRPKKRMDNVRLEISELKGASGSPGSSLPKLIETISR